MGVSPKSCALFCILNGQMAVPMFLSLALEESENAMSSRRDRMCRRGLTLHALLSKAIKNSQDSSAAQ